MHNRAHLPPSRIVMRTKEVKVCKVIVTGLFTPQCSSMKQLQFRLASTTGCLDWEGELINYPVLSYVLKHSLNTLL